MKKNYREQFDEICHQRNQLYKREIHLLIEWLEEHGGSYKCTSDDFFSVAPCIQVVQEGCMEEYLTTMYVKEINIVKMGHLKEVRVVAIENGADPENEYDEQNFNVNAILDGFIGNIAYEIDLEN